MCPVAFVDADGSCLAGAQFFPYLAFAEPSLPIAANDQQLISH